MLSNKRNIRRFAMPVKSSSKENLIELELIIRVRAAGGVCEKTTVMGRRGFFDRVVVLPGGRVIFVELKRPRGGVLSVHQKLRIAQYQALGVEVAIVRNSGDIAQLFSKK